MNKQDIKLLFIFNSTKGLGPQDITQFSLIYISHSSNKMKSNFQTLYYQKISKYRIIKYCIVDYCSNFDIITLKNLDKNMEKRPSIKKKPPPPKKKEV